MLVVVPLPFLLTIHASVARFTGILEREGLWRYISVVRAVWKRPLDAAAPDLTSQLRPLSFHSFLD